ncbi:4-alpha-glucanotransferase [Salinispira pacifica]|uniref:4-alpha-glucanotransferase n=1 Tax=Salinispira pacifica TaxID=1307761 RepID=V5WCT5_9SPIO|nr:4-alpha-glucanotransferase [Salinispira pacifica]AHC13618.1 4-alpha-glucanotransferase (amylomaltase) [Salinispira pacifica]
MSRLTNARKSGILLHPTALPGKYGIGTLGREAFNFVDFLTVSRQRLWQICPLGPTGFGDSPYQCFSAYAGNPYLIDLDLLIEEGSLTGSEPQLKELEKLSQSKVEFGKMIPHKMKLLETAFSAFWTKLEKQTLDEVQQAHYRRYLNDNASWLNDYAEFMVIKEMQKGVSWDNWPEKYRMRDGDTLEAFRRERRKDIEFQKYLQFQFHRQWTAVRNYAHSAGIQIIGDMPIFVAYDSVDVWANPELFQLDAQGKPTHVAGVPPDYFSATGQLWGNPLYDWEHMKENGFSWWIDVLKSKMDLYDIVRIDHFRGFEAYWAVPYGDTTAVNGQWVKAPGKELFTAIMKALPEADIIAEDLGVITPEVEKLIAFTGYPGMKVLQFAFDSNDDNDFLPHNYVKNAVVYTGTHDNETVNAWYANSSPEDRNFATEYLQLPKENTEVHWDFIRSASASVAATAVFPLQDILGLGEEGRFNFPGTLGGNWDWRFRKEELTMDHAHRLGRITELFGRS